MRLRRHHRRGRQDDEGERAREGEAGPPAGDEDHADHRPPSQRRHPHRRLHGKRLTHCLKPPVCRRLKFRKLRTYFRNFYGFDCCVQYFT